jgi:ribosome-associated toxin RatA of RatAB toxin-antitoxin module
VKELNGTASQAVGATIEECYRFLEEVERYPSWHPEVVRQVEVVERDGGGRPAKAHTKLHVARGPLVKDFDLLMDVVTQRPESIVLTRIPHDPSDHERFEVRWRLREQGAGTTIRLDVEATLSIPRMVPVGGIGDAMAGGFVVAAANALGPSTGRSR